MKKMCLIVFCFCLVACASDSKNITVNSVNAKPVPTRDDRNNMKQLLKGDLDRIADIEYLENIESLKTLMLKLYKRNPKEAFKSSIGNTTQIIEYVFDPNIGHHFKLKEINEKTSIDAIQQALSPEFQGDRVLSLTIGLYSMLYKAHGDKNAFYIVDSIEPQNLYNTARNVEIAMWKLSQAHTAQGELLLLSNECNAGECNLSFEREFAKIIARTDLLALVLAEKSQRLISKITQSIATSPFIRF